MRTTETYNYNTTHFIQYLDEFHEVNEIEDVSTVHVKKYIQHQLNLGKKATNINIVIKSLRSFYTHLVAEEYVTLKKCMSDKKYVPNKLKKCKRKVKVHHMNLRTMKILKFTA
ncbi:site-specific integrase [Lysinibacillus sp. G4S2]|nr:site-specific integrase [Lysinibacillus sp. G4S2]MDM5250125.1 site-specific integrase [Lysinibacillus sp. G4S2]